MTFRKKYHRYYKFDYSSAGYYYITICCHDRKCLFGDIVDDQMVLNEMGEIAQNEWQQIPQRFKNALLDVFQIMPNHLHGIIILRDMRFSEDGVVDTNNINRTEVSSAATENGIQNRTEASSAATIGDILKAYKSLVFNNCLKIYKERNQYMGKIWQENYHDHIIRNSESHFNIGTYIINNPLNWKDDEYF